MSRVAKKPVALPKGVDCQVQAGAITVKGPKGTLKIDSPAGVDVAVADGEIQLKAQSQNDTKMAGTARALLNNMVKGVSEGYSKKLELVGTTDWIVRVGDKVIAASSTYEQLGEHGDVKLDWGANEGGGGSF